MFSSPKKVTPPAKGLIRENPWNGGPGPAGVDGQGSFRRAVSRGLTREQLPREVKPSGGRSGHSGSSQTSSPSWSCRTSCSRLLSQGRSHRSRTFSQTPRSAPLQGKAADVREGPAAARRSHSLIQGDRRARRCCQGTAGTQQSTARARLPNPGGPKGTERELPHENGLFLRNEPAKAQRLGNLRSAIRS